MRRKQQNENENKNKIIRSERENWLHFYLNLWFLRDTKFAHKSDAEVDFNEINVCLNLLLKIENVI